MDPLFALFVGLTAAGVRIRKDEKLAGYTTKDTLDKLRRRMRMLTHTVGLG
jgi:hypothetical protein